MVDQKFFWTFLLLIRVLISQQSTLKLLEEESKNVYLGAREKLHPETSETSECVHLEQQEESLLAKIRVKKSETPLELYHWTKDQEGHVIVPYQISLRAQFTVDQMKIIRQAMDAIERETCIRFQPRKFAIDFIFITAGRFCKSSLGRVGGAQQLSLNKIKCLKRGHVIHELLHALGFIHMHNRPDRDKYVTILWNNIDTRYLKEFDRVNPLFFNHYGTPYDYLSIMHYGPTAITKNGGTTIVTKNKASMGYIGQRIDLSKGDVFQINTKYNCKR